MPYETSDVTSPLEPFAGRHEIPGFELDARWFAGTDLDTNTRDELVALIRTAFNGNPSWAGLGVPGSEHLEWKLRDYPLGSTAMLTTDPDGRIVGFMGQNRRTWLLGGKPYVGSFGYDLCRLPEWQGRGLGRALDAISDVEWHPADAFQIGEWTHPADRHLAIENGVKPFANESHDYVRFVDPVGFVRDIANRRRRRVDRPHRSAAPVSPSTVSNTAATLRAREGSRRDQLLTGTNRLLRFVASLPGRRPARRRYPWSITTLSRFDEQHESFIVRALSQFDFVGERPVAYLNWRFCDERGGSFTVRVAHQDGEHLGYAVTRARKGGAYVADILALPGRTDVAESLVRDAIDLSRAARSRTLRTRLPKRHPYRRVLARTGFFDVGHVAGEMVDPRFPDDPAFELLQLEDARIHYVLADSDWV